MTLADPYPAELLEELPTTAPDALVNAITRLAQAIETLAASGSGPQVAAIPAQPRQQPALAPLPPVTSAGPRPVCPIHGPAKVAPSGKFKGWYCTAKSDGKFCTWNLPTP